MNIQTPITEKGQLVIAKEILEMGGLVAIPTETVYGLAANTFNENAVKNIFQTKGRPMNNPLIVHIGKFNMLSKLAKNIPIEAIELIDEFWPGPLTLVLDRKEIVSDYITGGRDTVAIRMPNHELTLSLLREIEFPLVAPSANRSNHISPTDPLHVSESLGDKAPFVLDGGRCGYGIESTIVGFNEGRVTILRSGAITREQIEACLGKSVSEVDENSHPIAPGMFKKHYSPNTPLRIVGEITEVERINERIGLLFRSNPGTELFRNHRVLSQNGDLAEIAANLYYHLYDLDTLGLEEILVESIPKIGIGIAINDRLNRAANIS